MCTVTIAPTFDNGFILTSNRDEAPDRIPLAPKFYETDACTLLYPKDKTAGGTWVGVSSKNRIICILNGAFSNHKKKDKYRVSRGIIAKDFMTCDHVVNTSETYNLNDVEPFTMVIADWNSSLSFYELIWDGDNKHFQKLPLEPKIWSSSTLYTEVMKKERLSWFKDFCSKNQILPETLLKFHKTAGKGNISYDVVMDRGHVKTTSITQIEKRGNDVTMTYENILEQDITTKTLILSK